MQCPNCEFNNIPGQRTCARCTSVLDFGSIDVTPPRAGTTVIPLRFRSRLEIIASGIDLRIGGISRRVGGSVLNDVSVAPLLRSIVPGWAHRHRGQRRLGWCLTGVWLGLILLSAVLMGGQYGWTAYFALVGWHGLAINLILNQRLLELNVLARMGTGLFIWGCLNVCIYLPAGVLLQRYITPFEAAGILSGPLLADGDLVLLTGASCRPTTFQQGDVVVYQLDRLTNQQGHAYAQIGNGWGIDRIIAVPGDHVQIDLGGIRVNDEPLPDFAMPIRPGYRQFRCDLTLPENRYFIIPSSLRSRFVNTSQEQIDSMFTAVSTVPAESISGRAIIRWRPFARAGFFGPTRSVGSLQTSSSPEPTP